MLAALLDTNVLWPSLRRDFLLSLAVEGLYRPLWSDVILRELRHHEHRKLEQRGMRGDAAWTKAAHLDNRLRRAFPDAIVRGWEPMEGSFQLPDRDDEHVVAAAVVGNADMLVTENAKDFPSDRMPVALPVLSAANFAHAVVDLDPAAARRALAEMSARYRSPQVSPDEILAQLVVRYDMASVAGLIRPAH